MPTESELNEKIVMITARIKREHPELSVYLAEMRVTIPDTDHTDNIIVRLQKYYDSLQSMLKKFTFEK